MISRDAGAGGQGGSSWSDRLRLIRLRRKKERWRFRDELAVIPRWIVIVLIVVFAIAQILGLLINLFGVANNGVIWPVSYSPVISSLALGGLITLCAVFFFPWILLLGYVNRDAKRRGMNSTLWTVVCIILMPAYVALGFIIYFLVREPLPYACPKCGATVGPGFNFCANCRHDLYPSCPSCKREIAENDKFCPFCGQELGGTTIAETTAG